VTGPHGVDKLAAMAADDRPAAPGSGKAETL